VLDANGQSLAYVYGRETKADADISNVLTIDEARRVASNVAKLETKVGTEQLCVGTQRLCQRTNRRN